MPIRFVPDSRLYKEYSYYQEHMTWVAKRPMSSTPLLFHAVWRGCLTNLHDFCLKSLVLTQSGPYEVWIWTSPEDQAVNKQFIDQWKPYRQVKFMKYIPLNEAVGTAYAAAPQLLLKAEAAAASDAFRLLVLAKYGGIYFDLDILFLRDLRDLCSVEFFYQWSNQPYGNSAVLCMFQDSANAHALIDRSVEINTCHPRHLLQLGAVANILADMYVFPCYTFDPVWRAHDEGIIINRYCNSIDEFFLNETSIDIDSFFAGSYAYHWHNHWGWQIGDTSIAGRLYSEINQRLADSFTCPP